MAAPESPPRSTRVLLPAFGDPIVRAATGLLGGPRGRRGRPTPRLIVTLVTIALATITWVVTIVQKVPCRYDQVGKSVDWFAWMCYSDIPLLYTGRGLADGNVPYLDSGNYQVLEYPVLTGGLLEFQRWITVALGAPVGPGLDQQQALDAAILFYDINQVVLFVLFLIAVVAQVYTPTGRPWDAVMMAVSPTIVLTGLINWDMFAVALTSLGCLFWARRMPVVAGVLLGLATAAKLYPLLLFGPLLLLCLRAGKLDAYAKALGAGVVAWLAANVPIMIAAPENWTVFWTFNSDRGGDLGSIWYVITLMTGREFENLNLINALLVVLGCALIGVLILVAPRRPRFAQVAYLVVFVFLVVNKVYSPQYVLWLLPLMVLARPRWRDWIIFTAGEVCYTLAIWGHLGQFTLAGNGGDRLYWLAVFFRIGCEAWIAAMIIRDVLRPGHDPVRSEVDPTSGQWVDDPAGGVLDRAPDAPWFRRVWDSMAIAGHGRDR